MISNQPTYLPIRSLGDFVVTACFVKRFSKQKIPVILPNYFTDLFEAMEADKYFTVTGTIGFKNQPAFFEMYKIKSAKEWRRLIHDFSFLKKSLDPSITYILDERSRRISFLPFKFLWPAPNQNRYYSKPEAFARYFDFGEQSYELSGISAPSGNNIILFPDSRIKDKEIDQALVDKIIATMPNANIRIARFGKGITGDAIVYYSNFKELISLILESSFIISADSLPYHLAFYYDKSHVVIYNAKSKFYTEFFRTPYMIEKQSFLSVDDSNIEESLAKIKAMVA